MSYAEQLLVDCLMAQGVERLVAVQAVRVVLGAAVAADIIPLVRLEGWERDARIYHLRGQRVTCVDLALRFHLDRAQIFRAIRKHQKRRRAALGVAS